MCVCEREKNRESGKRDNNLNDKQAALLIFTTFDIFTEFWKLQRLHICFEKRLKFENKNKKLSVS